MTAHRAHTDAPSGDHDAVCDSIDPGARTHRHMAFAAPLAWRHTTGGGLLRLRRGRSRSDDRPDTLTSMYVRCMLCGDPDGGD
jgi:hypothetical protein